MSRYLKGVSVLALVPALVGCGGGGASERPCTGIGAQAGVGLDIAPPMAARTAKAVLKICWDSSCRTRRIHLSPSTRSVPTDCTGREPDDVCGAAAVRTGGKNGFADLPGLPKRPIKVTVILSDAVGKHFLNRRIDVTPKAVFPNGPGCGEGGPQAALIAENNQLRVRA